MFLKHFTLLDFIFIRVWLKKRPTQPLLLDPALQSSLGEFFNIMTSALFVSAVNSLLLRHNTSEDWQREIYITIKVLWIFGKTAAKLLLQLQNSNKINLFNSQFLINIWILEFLYIFVSENHKKGSDCLFSERISG